MALPSQGHVYKYLVQGQDAKARFAWFEPVTSDNYGVLSITVQAVQDLPTDAPPAMRVSRVIALPNIPDPFNPSTQIRYVLPSASEVSVRVYDVRGRLLRRIFAGYQGEGYQTVTWNGSRDSGGPAPSGTYYVLIEADGEMAVEKVTLLK